MSPWALCSFQKQTSNLWYIKMNLNSSNCMWCVYSTTEGSQLATEMLLTVPPLAVGQCWSKPAGRGFHMLTVAATFLITIYCMKIFISSTFQLIGFALFCLLRHLSVLFKVNEECSEGDLCVDRAVEIGDLPAIPTCLPLI